MEETIFSTSSKSYHIRPTKGGNFKVLIKTIYGKKRQVYTISPKYGFKTKEKAKEYADKLKSNQQ